MARALRRADLEPQGVAEGDEHAAARHGLVALVLADGLRRDAVADRGGEAAQREPRGRARQP